MKPELIDNDLLKGLAEGDRKCIELIYKSHFNMIQTLVINNSGSIDDARDIFQEALVVLYEKVRMGSFELNCQLKTYLYSVCKRLWLKRLQYNSRYVTPDVEVELTVSVEEDMAAHEKRDAFRQFMSDRGIATMVYYPLPLHRQNAYFQEVALPVTEELCSQVVSLPICPELRVEAQQEIIFNVKEFFQKP